MEDKFKENTNLYKMDYVERTLYGYAWYDFLYVFCMHKAFGFNQHVLL